MFVRDFLEHTADQRGEKVGLICGSGRFRYGELDAAADRLARALQAQGLQPGDRVVIHLPNCVEAVIGIFAALKAGAIFVPTNPSVKGKKLAYIMNHCRAFALLTEQRVGNLPETPWLKVVVACGVEAPEGAGASRVAGAGASPSGWVAEEARPWRPSAAVVDFASIQAEPWSGRPRRVGGEEDLACLIYTSGSTGQPKGVMSEQRNVVFASGSIISYLENSESDVVLNVLPLSFDYGLYQLLMTFRFGGTLVLEPSFAYPGVILERLATERVSGFPGVPTIWSLLLGLDCSGWDLSRLRYLTNTAAGLAPKQALALADKFPQARLYLMYGLTETKRTLYLPPEELKRRPESVGIPIPGTEAWIEDEAGRRLGPGETGELVICGPHVMRGYWEDAAASAQRFGPGPTPERRICRSGDLFRQDEGGYFYFVGRRDDIIKSRGEKVAPKEVEDALYELGGVAEAVVLGVPDPVLGQAIKAYIVCRGPRLTRSQVLAHCRRHLEDFMVPREVEFRESLPRNGSGKIDRLALGQEGLNGLEAGAGKTGP